MRCSSNLEVVGSCESNKELKTLGVRIRIREATEQDLPFVVGLLKSNDLCYEDIPQKVRSLFIGYVDSKVVGTGGVEVYGQYGLLRSLAVEQPFRGKGYGKALVSKVIESAMRKGVKELYLLTTSAENFFTQLGFRKVERNNSPAAIQNTTEFKELCAVTSILMRKKIA